MPAMLMAHDVDPREALQAKIGDVDTFELSNNQVLCAVYMRPPKTKSNLYLPEKHLDEDRYQSKVGLILKIGPTAFKDETGRWHWPEGVGVGDWIVFRPSDGWNVTLNGSQENICRMLDDTSVRMRIAHPDMVW